MATYTPNYNLVKPDYEEPADIAQLNNNADLIDAALAEKQATLTFDTTPTSGSTNPVTSGGVYTEAGNLAAGMAILANNNTHAAIASGQYVYVRGHGSLSDGLYKATAAIAANGTLSTSNLTAVSGGGLNAVNSDLKNFSTYTLVNKTGITTDATYVSEHNLRYSKRGGCVTLCGWLRFGAIPSSNSQNIITGLPKPVQEQEFIAFDQNAKTTVYFIMRTNGSINPSVPSSSFTVGNYINLAHTYVTSD